MKRILLIAVIAIILCSTLYSMEYNVLVLPANEEIENYVSSFFRTKITDSLTKADLQNSLIESQKRSLGETLHSAYKNENEDSIEKSSKELNEPLLIDIPDILDVKVSTSSFSLDVDAIENEDILYLDYICSKNGANLLIIPIVSEIEGFNRMRLFVYDRSKSELSLEFQRLSKETEEYSVIAALSIAGYFSKNPCSLVHLDSLVIGSSVLIDDNEVIPVDGYVLLEEGNHEIQLSHEGYASRRVGLSITEEGNYSFDASLQRLSNESIEILSEPVSNVYMNGVLLGRTPLSIEEYDIPLVLMLEEDGYSKATVATYGNDRSLKVNLKPSWMEDGSLYSSSRDSFYWGFARSLLIFGGGVALNAFNDGSNGFINAARIACSGALVLSITDMISSLIDYYRSSEYISI